MAKLKARELTSIEPMKVARHLLKTRYLLESGRTSIILISGTWWAYMGYKWRAMDHDWLKADLRLGLEDLTISVLKDKNTNEFVIIRYASSHGGSYSQKVNDVLGALESLCSEGKKKMPFWRDPKPDDMDPRFCIAALNTVICIQNDNLHTEIRDDRFVTPATLPVEWDPEARSSDWETCLDQWSNGEAEWIELLQRWWGYVFLPYRGYAKWMYMFGKIRGGKGLNLRLCDYLLGGDPAYLGMDLEDLCEPFGQEGLNEAMVLGIAEVNELEGKKGEKCAKVLKTCLGQDSKKINRKNRSYLKGVTSDPAPWVCGNEILVLPNKGLGLSGKMLPLWFRTSFADKMDLNLEDRLRSDENLRGIVNWAISGALKLVNSKMGEEWPMGDSSREVLKLFRIYNSPLEQFLDAHFVVDEKGFVPSKLVHSEWDGFLKRNKVRGLNIHKNQLLLKMEQETGWPILRKDVVCAGVKTKVLMGISLKKRDRVDHEI